MDKFYIEFKKEENGHYRRLDKLKLQALVQGGYAPNLIPEFTNLDMYKVYGSFLKDIKIPWGLRDALREAFGTLPVKKALPMLWALNNPEVIQYVLLESRKLPKEQNIYDIFLANTPEDNELLINTLNINPQEILGEEFERILNVNHKDKVIRVNEPAIIGTILTPDKTIDPNKLQIAKAEIVNDAIIATKRFLDSLKRTTPAELKKTSILQRANTACKLMDKIQLLAHGIIDPDDKEAHNIIDLLDQTMPTRKKDAGYNQEVEDIEPEK